MERMNSNLQNVKSNKQRSLDKLNFDGQKNDSVRTRHSARPRNPAPGNKGYGRPWVFPPIPPSSPQFPRSEHCPRAVRASQGFS